MPPPLSPGQPQGVTVQQYVPPPPPKSGQMKVLVIVLVSVFVGLILIGALAISILLPSLSKAREFANRIKCGNNLRSIGQSFMLYVGSDTRLQSLPRTTYVAGPNPTVTWGTGNMGPFPPDPENPYKPTCGVQPNDVTALLYHAMATTNAITTQTFVCPSSNADAWDIKSTPPDAYVNWSAQPKSPNDYHAHLSYSVQNPYVSDHAIGKGFDWKAGGSCQRTDFAIAADINPGAGPKSAVGSTALPPQQTAMSMSQAQLRGANSPNHDCDGQNVLYGDGHVDWSATPWCGVSNDNIYTYRKTTPSTGPGAAKPADQGLSSQPGAAQSPFDCDDSILLPTAE